MREKDLIAKLKKLHDRGRLSSLPQDKKLYAATLYRAKKRNMSVGDYIYSQLLVEYKPSFKKKPHVGSLKTRLSPQELFKLLYEERKTSVAIAKAYGTSRQNIERIRDDYIRDFPALFGEV